jgi:hypothetical protein
MCLLGRVWGEKKVMLHRVYLDSAYQTVYRDKTKKIRSNFV